jgi:hypothetical protein
MDLKAPGHQTPARTDVMPISPDDKQSRMCEKREYKAADRKRRFICAWRHFGSD